MNQDFDAGTPSTPLAELILTHYKPLQTLTLKGQFNISIFQNEKEGPGQRHILPSDSNLLILHQSTEAIEISRQMGQKAWESKISAYESICLTPSGTESRWAWSGGSQNLIFNFKNEVFQYFLAGKLILEGPNLQLKPSLAVDDPFLIELMRTLKQAIDQEDRLDQLYAESILHTLFWHLLRHYSKNELKIREIPSGSGLTPFKKKKLIDYIEGHLHEKLSLAQLAALVEMNPYYFSRVFKVAMGLPPYRYVITQRIERAKTLLQDPQKSILEVCQGVGYENQSHFTRLFTEIVGLPPDQYRKQFS